MGRTAVLAHLVSQIFRRRVLKTQPHLATCEKCRFSGHTLDLLSHNLWGAAPQSGIFRSPVGGAPLIQNNAGHTDSTPAFIVIITMTDVVY